MATHTDQPQPTISPAGPAAPGASASPSREPIVEPATLKAWLDSGHAVVIDVREPDEFAREHIRGARLVPLPRVEPSTFPYVQGRIVVLHCKSGRRSAEAAARLSADGNCEVVQLRGGIEAWKQAGFPVEQNARMPIPIMRQVQLTVGLMILVTSILAGTVSPWFLLLTGFFGAGLIFAGATGMCGLTAVLSSMPWNRALRRAVAASGARASGSCCGGGRP